MGIVFNFMLCGSVVLFLTGCSSGGGTQSLGMVGDVSSNDIEKTSSEKSIKARNFSSLELGEFMSDITKPAHFSNYPLRDENTWIRYWYAVDGSNDITFSDVNATLINDKNFTLIDYDDEDLSSAHYLYVLDSADSTIKSISTRMDVSGGLLQHIEMNVQSGREYPVNEIVNTFALTSVEADAVRVTADTEYNANLSGEFADYYAQLTASGGLFDLTLVDVDCFYDGVEEWNCWKGEEDNGYFYYVYLMVEPTMSTIRFEKRYVGAR